MTSVPFQPTSVVKIGFVNRSITLETCRPFDLVYAAAIAGNAIVEPDNSGPKHLLQGPQGLYTIHCTVHCCQPMDVRFDLIEAGHQGLVSSRINVTESSALIQHMNTTGTWIKDGIILGLYKITPLTQLVCFTNGTFVMTNLQVAPGVSDLQVQGRALQAGDTLPMLYVSKFTVKGTATLSVDFMAPDAIPGPVLLRKEYDEEKDLVVLMMASVMETILADHRARSCALPLVH